MTVALLSLKLRPPTLTLTGELKSEHTLGSSGTWLELKPPDTAGKRCSATARRVYAVGWNQTPPRPRPVLWGRFPILKDFCAQDLWLPLCCGLRGRS